MLNLFLKEYSIVSDNILYTENDISLIPEKFLSNRLEHLIYNNCGVSFEQIVLFISELEDIYDIDLKSISINCNVNKRIVFDMLDFYGAYGLNINVICNNIMTPFKVIHDIFINTNLTSFYNYGLCFDLCNLDELVWLNEATLQTTKKYIHSGFSKDKYYLRKGYH